MKIRPKLIISFMLLSLTATTVLGYIFFTQGSQAISERTRAQMESVVILKESELNDYLVGDTENLLNVKSKLSEIILDQQKKDNYTEDVRGLLNDRLKGYSNFIELFVLDLNGTVYASTDPDQEGKIKSGEPYFIEGSKQTFIQSFYYDVALQEVAITISTPLEDGRGRAAGVLAGRVNLEKINEIMLRTSGMGDTGETYLVNRFNYMITGSRFEKGAELKKTIYTDGVKDCLKGNSGHGYYLDHRGVPVIGAYAWIPDKGVCMLAEIGQEDALAPINKLKDTLILVAIVTVVGVSVISVFLASMITNPLMRLMDGTEELRKGNMDARVNIKSGDEIGLLAEAFNNMASDLKSNREKLVKTEENKRKELEELVKWRTAELEGKTKELESSRVATLNILEDVSDAKDKLDQSYVDLRKLDSLKDDFVNIGAHELKTPLIPIIGYLSMVLKDPTLSEANRKKLEIAFRAARREENLVKDVLDISKLESGNMKFDMGEVDLGDIVERSVQEMQSLARDHGNVLEAKRQENMPKIQGDSQRLSQVVTNLISNAVKFTDKGTVTAEAGAQNGSVYVRVKDTGIGMPAEALPKLFNKFYQVDSSLSRNHDGTGLGLVICKKIVEAHGGRIWVESAPGQGSTFSFSIPVNKQAN